MVSQVPYFYQYTKLILVLNGIRCDTCCIHHYNSPWISRYSKKECKYLELLNIFIDQAFEKNVYFPVSGVSACHCLGKEAS